MFKCHIPRKEDWFEDAGSQPPLGDCWYRDGSLCEGYAGTKNFGTNNNFKLSIPLGRTTTVPSRDYCSCTLNFGIWMWGRIHIDLLRQPDAKLCLTD